MKADQKARGRYLAGSGPFPRWKSKGGRPDDRYFIRPGLNNLVAWRFLDSVKPKRGPSALRLGPWRSGSSTKCARAALPCQAEEAFETGIDLSAGPIMDDARGPPEIAVAGTKLCPRIPATLRRRFRWRNPLIPPTPVTRLRTGTLGKLTFGPSRIDFLR
jgi:hypothetical protein